MVHRATHFFRLPAAVLAVAAFPLIQSSAPGQAASVHPAQFDPSDVYFQGYLAARAAEKLEQDGEFIEAWKKLDQARKLFESVRQFHPDWKPEMVAGRAEKTVEALEAVQPKAEAQQLEGQNAIAELEGGVRAGGRMIDPAQGVEPLTPGILEVDPLETRRLREAEGEVERLKNLIEDSRISETEASRNASRLRDIERSRSEMQARLRAAEAQLQSMRSRMAASPVEEELKGLNQRIENLEQERDALGMALNQSRDQQTRAMAKIATLEADLRAMQTQAAEMRQKEADLQRDLETEREVANDLVAGMRRQLQDMDRKLEGKNAELAAAHEQIAGLRQELQETREAFSELREERDTLLQEREHMAALLKLNEDGRIQELIEQNMGLAKQLREANERVEQLNIHSNADKDALLHALRDLAIAKERINSLQSEKRAQDRRLAELENRLRREQTALSNGEAGADPAEAEMLRDIIRRQLRVQERRRQARDILVEAVRKLGKDDERIASAIQLFDGEELHLTPEEQRLLADQKVDGEFISPFARDREAVGRSTADLNRELDTYNRAAEKAFIAGRLLPTRELFQMMVDLHPGHTPALCKLGLVHYKLGEYPAASETFQRAVELDGLNPYAHRMLGLSRMHLGELGPAEASVRASVDLAPEDARGHVLLGMIVHEQGRFDEAETHYKAAIAADPMPSEPYFNLAMLCANHAERIEEARNFYMQALERGALPDPQLEQRIHQP